MAEVDKSTETVEDKETDTGKDEEEVKDETKKDSKSETKTEIKSDKADKESDKEKDSEKGSDKEDKEPNSKTDKTDDKADPEIEKLQLSIGEKETELSTLNQELDSVKEENGKHVERTKELEAVIAGVVENKVSIIPKDYRDLMPEGDPIKQLAWLNKAEEKGVFNKEKEKPEVEIGKNMALDKKGEQKAKEEISSHDRLANYFSKAFSGK